MPNTKGLNLVTCMFIEYFYFYKKSSKEVQDCISNMVEIFKNDNSTEEEKEAAFNTLTEILGLKKEKKMIDEIKNLFDNGLIKDAEIAINEELNKTPSDHWLMTMLGRVYCSQEKYEGSVNILKESLEIDKSCPITLKALGTSLSYLGNYEEAIKAYKKIINSKSSYENNPCWENEERTKAYKADAKFQIGLCLKTLKKGEEARKYFNKYKNLVRNEGVNGTYPIAALMAEGEPI